MLAYPRDTRCLPASGPYQDGHSNENGKQEAQLLLGDRATRKHAKIAEMDVEMTT